jgi:2-polyprenyl-3-methyl-5-hydroxy-6-metoxy-1,4-benzoquinol methylase
MFSRRSDKKEILDDLNLSGEELHKNLAEIERINTFLGGHSVILNAIGSLAGKELTVLDVGCGSGDTLRVLERKIPGIKCVGIDANQNIIDYAKHQLKTASKIEFVKGDCFDEKIYESLKADVIICSLFLHHFKDEEIKELIDIFRRYTKTVIINDLHRNWLAYYGFKVISFLFGASKITKHDGSISVLRGFTKKDWNSILQRVPEIDYTLSWKWAFRYQVIINSK